MAGTPGAEPPTPTLNAIVVGSVFRDANGNGVRESTEHGQANARVYLDYNGNGTRDGDAEPIAITTTTGTYRFEHVRTDAPVQLRLLLTGTNLIQTLPVANAPRTVTAAAGQTREVEPFGVNEPVVPPPPATTGTVVGTVFRDLNGNGTRESTEPGQANVRVYLDLNANGLRDGDAEPLVVTTSTGAYRFERVAPSANLNIRLLLTGTNFVQTRPSNNAARIVTSVAGQVVEAESFGVNEVPPPPPPAITVLSGLVYTDRNRNGARDMGENGRANVRVYLDLDADGTRDDGEPVAVTNNVGIYRFERVAAGVTTIRLLLAGTNLQQTSPANDAPIVTTVIAGQSNVVADPFGVAERVLPTPPPVQTAVVGGTVFYDANSNGVRDPNEVGRRNVRVYLDLDGDATRDANEPTILTATNGAYRFERAPAVAALKIRLDLTGVRLTQTLPAANAAITLMTEAGQVYRDQNFGVHETSTASLATSGTTGLRGRNAAALFGSDPILLA